MLSGAHNGPAAHSTRAARSAADCRHPGRSESWRSRTRKRRAEKSCRKGYEAGSALTTDRPGCRARARVAPAQHRRLLRPRPQAPARACRLRPRRRARQRDRAWAGMFSVGFESGIARRFSPMGMTQTRLRKAMHGNNNCMIRIGCSGWSYEHWRGLFYPQSGSTSRWLELYAESFDTVEINATFYRLPSAKTVESWAKRLPTRSSLRSRRAGTSRTSSASASSPTV